MQNASCRVEENASWGFEEDLPSLACYAAIELDELLTNKNPNLCAVERLKDVISKFESKQSQGLRDSPLSYLEPSTAVALNFAIADSDIATSQSNIYDLMKEADHLIISLNEVIKNQNNFKDEHPEKIIQLKSFCLALSKRALSNMPSIDVTMPQHPFRS